MKKTSAKKLRELLAGVRLHNEAHLFKPVLPTPPVISYRSSNRHQRGRWVVTRAGHKTDPKHGHFLDAYNKVFPVDGVNSKQTQLVRAIGWASEKYGYTIDEWEKTPFGSWAPKDALKAALLHYLPELFEESTSTSDPTVKRITDKLYSEDPEWVESTLDVESTSRPVDSTSESITRAQDSSVSTDGWYRVVGANVAVFIQAASTDDAKNRVTHMIQRMSMDCSLELYTTKRDPEVH